MTDQYAVIGNPIKHSKSPRIHDLFAKQTGEDIEYTALLAATDDFDHSVMQFIRQGGKGMNVTVPFKQQAFAISKHHSDRAARAGAVNTLIFTPDGGIIGDNTDGAGLLTDLTQNLGLSLADKDILLLGAGGAVRGILQPLIAQQPRSLFIANRTVTKAETLAKDFRELFKVGSGSFESLQNSQWDLIINATSASLTNTLPPLPDNLLKQQACCYDLMYASQPTPFMVWAQQQNAALVVDGLGMLVEQAAESFYLWRQVRPETRPVMVVLRQ